jgi:hypothetical protein
MVGRIALGGAGIAALALGVVWGSRDRIATDLIDRQLAALNLPARYRIESIGLGREVLGAVAVGDPAHPDLTIERVEIALRYGYAGPELDRITLVRPRFHGRLVGGRISLGSLDRVLYGPSSGAVRLPDWSLALVDARGRIETPYGLVGLSADGRGRLSDGFAGTLGAIVPQAQFPGPCMLARTTLYASVTTSAGRPRLAGPLRIGSGQCGRDTRFAPGKVDLAIGGDATLANWTLGGHWALGRIDSGRQLSLTGISGDAGLRFQSGRNQAPAGDLAGRITIAVNGLTTPALRLGNAKLDGVVHVRPGQGLELRGDCVGTALSRGPATLAMLDRARTTTRGTPFGPLLDRLATTLAREEPGSRLAGSLGLHRDGMGWRIAVPSLALRGGRSGQALARLDQFALTAGADGVPRLSGDFTTGGADFPAISGTMQFAGAGTAHLQLAMEHYGAAGADLAIPRMAVTQSRNGSLAFSGTAALSGPVGEGGRIDNLVMPVEGAVATDGQIALLRHCVRPSFDRLRTGTLDLARNAVTLCPVGGAIVRTNGAGAQIAATMPAFALAGRSSDAPLSVRAGGARIAWPGGGAMKSVDVALGAGAQANRLHLAEVTIARGSTAAALGGTFTGGVVAMPALPATVDAAGGDWRLEGARLTLGGAAFTLADRVNPGRFAPVAVRNARMTLVDGAVDATAHLVAPKSAADLGDVIVHHDLTSGKGFAQVAIAGVTFRDPAAKDKPTAPGLQPADLSDLAKGVVANASGTIRGKARFDWNSAAPDGGVRGSGTFSSDDFDFAAALGPVEGLSGTIEFTDLVHLVTAPHQILKIASINPGIEVIDGMVDLELRAGQVVRLNRAQWPFEGGTIHLEPTDLNMAVSEPRKLTLVIAGLEAGRFLQHTNMSNLSATGMFDGRLPLVFDAQGGRIVGGQLVSRPPGGNVSYVGALSYRDLSPMANFAFRMLRSVDYASMTIGMDGDLAGEVITRVSFGGIHQGKGAERNLITRQLAALPIRFDVNVRAQFYQLVGSLRSLYDPSLVRDPRELGLVDAQGRPIHHHGQVGVAPPGPPPSATSSSIQHQASGTMP